MIWGSRAAGCDHGHAHLFRDLPRQSELEAVFGAVGFLGRKKYLARVSLHAALHPFDCFELCGDAAAVEENAPTLLGTLCIDRQDDALRTEISSGLGEE